MTNKIAIGLGLFILAAFAMDYLLFGGTMPVFLGQRILELSEYIAFWR